jgi:hypothetical protein
VCACICLETTFELDAIFFRVLSALYVSFCTSVTYFYVPSDRQGRCAILRTGKPHRNHIESSVFVSSYLNDSGTFVWLMYQCCPKNSGTFVWLFLSTLSRKFRYFLWLIYRRCHENSQHLCGLFTDALKKIPVRLCGLFIDAANT